MTKIKITKKDGSIEYVTLQGIDPVEIDCSMGEIERIDLHSSKTGWRGIITCEDKTSEEQTDDNKTP